MSSFGCAFDLIHTNYSRRTNVADDSFNLDISGLDVLAAPPPEPATVRRTPNTSAKRRRLDNEAPPTIPQSQESASRRSPRSVPKNPYDLPDTSEESVTKVVSVTQTRRLSPRVSPAERITRASKSKSPAIAPIIEPEPEADAIETLPDPKTFQSPAVTRISSVAIEEIEESPANAPGSGKRRIVSSGGVPTSVRLRSAVSVEADVPPSSSPLARKVRRSDATTPSARSARSARSTRGQSLRLAEMDEADELSPDRPVDSRPPIEDEELSETHPLEEPEQADAEATDEEPIAEVEVEETEVIEPEEAEEIGEVEAAKVLGRKRPRRSLRSGSPELGNTEAEEEESLSKRRRGRPARTPVTQRQSAPKPKAKTKSSEPKPKEKPAPKMRKSEKGRRESVEDDGPSIEITVQRFVNVKQHILEEADEDDPLQSELPFANRGETVVDVFAQVCTELINATLVQFQEFSRATEDKAKKKEIRIKMRAIEAYREQLNSRLLQHVSCATY